MRKLVLITGASSGIGAAFAQLYAEKKHDLALVARRRDRLEEMAAQIRNAHGVQVLVIEADLCDPAAPDMILGAVQQAERVVDVFVNNAGYGEHGSFVKKDWRTYDRYLQAMLYGPLRLVHMLLPGLIERGYGRIINVSSMAAFMHGIPSESFYCGIKSFIVKFTEAVNAELQGTGVHMTSVCPGPTRTDFFTSAGVVDEMAKTPGFIWLDARDVALLSFDAVEANQPVIITGFWTKLITLLVKVIPNEWAWWVSRKQARQYDAVM